ncbi:uncharacterized protein MONBRDRAFT_33555 [Monosiga brevicollis MX1]|uniref:Uncharacterized protein n=1 Tax=Monosiga brevicollis TaxID=81824 RepID=A9V618_MONBE|nr:uncharacterized protein MONBRDRAFT_33555 [Monosiga brevicollis MX1]EDQ86997.1 predicted protein [Monosiga brevicollis MX1]|eukprot:XP_001748236.1 hypothetical protein [Monosiga brevicollis MX1]
MAQVGRQLAGLACGFVLLLMWSSSLFGAPGAAEPAGRMYLDELGQLHIGDEAGQGDINVLGVEVRHTLAELNRLVQAQAEELEQLEADRRAMRTTLLLNGAMAEPLTLELPQPQDGAQFGYAVGIAGDRVAMGLPGYNGGQGSVYVHRRPRGQPWVAAIRDATLEGDAPGANFGKALALDGTTLAVSQFFATNATSVRIFDEGATATQTILPAPALGVTPSTRFGASLALSNDLLFIGDPGARLFDVSDNVGAVFVYARAQPSAGTFALLQALTGNAMSSQLRFGLQLAAYGPELSVTSVLQPAAFQVNWFACTPQGCKRRHPAATFASTDDRGNTYQAAMALLPDALLLASQGVDATGEVLIYHRLWDNTLAATPIRIPHPSPVTGSLFGCSIAVDDDATLIVGAYRQPHDNITDGIAYLFP